MGVLTDIGTALTIFAAVYELVMRRQIDERAGSDVLAELKDPELAEQKEVASVASRAQLSTATIVLFTVALGFFVLGIVAGFLAEPIQW